MSNDSEEFDEIVGTEVKPHTGYVTENWIIKDPSTITVFKNAIYIVPSEFWHQ